MTICKRLDNTRRFTIYDSPVLPYVRMTQASKWVNDAAQRYLTNQAQLQLELAMIMRRDYDYKLLPAKTPLWVEITLVVTNRLHTKDGDNQLKALLDAMSKIVYPDDRWIDCHAFLRYLGPQDKVSIEVGELMEAAK